MENRTIKMPNSVCWNITSQCNDACLFCYRDRQAADLNAEDRKQIIDKIAWSGIKKLTFAGGEPLLLPEIKELLQYAQERDLITSLTTNAILLKGELLDFCLEHLDWLTLSLDGENDSVQNQMTRNSGHFKRVQSILKYAKNHKKRRCRIKINTLISRMNRDHILKIADLMAACSVERWKLFQFVPLRGNAREHNEVFGISDHDFKETVREAQLYLENKGILVSVSGRDNIENAYFVIFPNGDVKISTGLQDVVLGNAMRDDLGQIWIDGNYQRELHEKRTGFIIRESGGARDATETISKGTIYH